MWLWNLKKARLFYCLNNTPDHIFESEARKMLWNNFVSEDSPEYIEAYNNLKEKHTHDSKPLEERFKVWDIELEDSDIEYMEKAVLLAREYLCSLNNERKERLAKNRELMGATNPKEAAAGTIRADFAESIDANAVHGSDSLENAANEINFFFAQKEIC